MVDGFGFQRRIGRVVGFSEYFYPMTENRLPVKMCGASPRTKRTVVTRSGEWRIGWKGEDGIRLVRKNEAAQ
jgi:hypothetical protein